ncbi:Wzz/FepE/Etk N-terminal domain-containing protein [Pseudomonas bharatica]|uniref:Wzz/FepE/Etk N-terminal domain-containing protein n=1 Tax=Pseudomonas bharatica TaxID=2692112 RepID=UPI003B2843FD
MRNVRERPIDEEIDLVELFQDFWKQKLLILMIILIFFISSCVYVFCTVPTYQAKVFVGAPSQNDISALNYGRGGGSGLRMLTVKDVYDVYLRNLQSESLRREFFRTVYLPALPEELIDEPQSELYLRFLSAITIGPASKAEEGRYFITARTSDPQHAAEWVVRYAQSAGRQGRAEIIQNVMADAKVKANNLEQEINLAREGARKQREDQIIQLNEALRVATTVGLEAPPIIPSGLSGVVSAGMDGALAYMRGTKALEAEINNLRNRASDDPFVPNLRERQESLAFYKALNVDSATVEVFQQDGAVETPDKPIEPKKGLILGLAVLAGLASGLGVAFLRGLLWRGARRNQVA